MTIVERHPERGFEAWRQLNKRFNPIGETYAFDKLTGLMHQPRCKQMSELPSAIERWEAGIRQYEDRSGETFPKVMKIQILMQMVPSKDLEQVVYRFRKNPEKDYVKFSKQLVEFGTERRYETMRGNGAVPMELDPADENRRGKGQGPAYLPVEGYTAEQWRDWYQAGMPEEEAEDQDADDLARGGKAGGKGRKGKGKGQGDQNCAWCSKPGHWKKDCREFPKWKDDRDADRVKKGLPPYTPPFRK